MPTWVQLNHWRQALDVCRGYDGNGYSISYSDAKGGRIFTIASDGSVSRFDLPLTWCGYYKAQGAGDANLSQSDDGLVQVELPEA